MPVIQDISDIQLQPSQVALTTTMFQASTCARFRASGRTTGSIRADHAARVPVPARAALQRPQQQPAHVRPHRGELCSAGRSWHGGLRANPPSLRVCPR